MSKDSLNFEEFQRQIWLREIARIKRLNDPVEQALSYRALLYSVLRWQGLALEVEEHLFSIEWEGSHYSLLFWPEGKESIRHKLGPEPVLAVLSQGQAECVLAASLVGFTEELHAVAREANGRILLLDGIDIDALCKLEWTFSQMMLFKLREVALYGQPDVNYLTYSAKQRVEEGITHLLSPLEEWLDRGADIDAEMFREDARARWIDFERGLIVEWPQISTALEFITNRSNLRRALIINGAAGSGKSTFLYTVGFRYALTSNAPVRYYNVSGLQMSNIEIVIDEAISLPEGALVLLDDLHQRAVLANKVIGAILAEGNGVRIVAATRPPYFTEVRETLHGPYGWRHFDIQRIDLDPEAIINELITHFARRKNLRISKGAIEQLKREVGRDLTLLGWVLRHIRTERVSTPSIYEEAVVKYRLKPLLDQPELGATALGLLYVVVFFEQFDVLPQEDFLRRLGFSETTINKLVTEGHLIRRHGMLGIGHANLARLYVNTLDKRTDLGWLPTVTEHLKSGEEVFARLEDVKIALLDAYFEGQKVDARSRAILNVFHYFAPDVPPTPLHQDMISMVSAVERAMDLLILYFQRDPTGENSVSNSAFMCQVFAKLGRMDLARQALDFILAQQEVHPDGTAQFVLDPLRVTTVKDFEEIRKRTAIEDREPDTLTVELLKRIYGEKVSGLADRVDFDRFHQTWLSAMVLPSIAIVYGKEHPRFEQTLRTVLKNQDPKEGWFYPPEFCWSTARCVINLVQVGLPLDSEPITGGLRWLLRLQLEDGRWHSPDWRWNPDEEMTAMCLYALLRAGLEREHPAIQRSLRWLLSRRRHGCWNNNAHDTGHVVEALNALGFPLDELREPLRFLERRVSADDWYQTIIGKERRQSLEIGEVANVLLDVETRYLFEYVRRILSSNT